MYDEIVVKVICTKKGLDITYLTYYVKGFPAKEKRYIHDKKRHARWIDKVVYT